MPFLFSLIFFFFFVCSWCKLYSLIEKQNWLLNANSTQKFTDHCQRNEKKTRFYFYFFIVSRNVLDHTFSFKRITNRYIGRTATQTSAEFEISNRLFVFILPFLLFKEMRGRNHWILCTNLEAALFSFFTVSCKSKETEIYYLCHRNKLRIC